MGAELGAEAESWACCEGAYPGAVPVAGTLAYCKDVGACAWAGGAYACPLLWPLL